MNKKIFLSFIFVIIFILFFPKETNAQTCPVSAGICPASVAGSCTLATSCIIPANGSMNVIDGNLTINAGVTLTMDTNSRLGITPGYSIFPNGTISMASGAYIKKTGNLVILNSASGKSCSTICSENVKTCSSIGQDFYATDTYYWQATACEFGSCQYVSGNCATVMSAQCSSANACCAINTLWTRCLCVDI